MTDATPDPNKVDGNILYAKELFKLWYNNDNINHSATTSTYATATSFVIPANKVNSFVTLIIQHYQARGAGLPGPTKVKGRYTENPGTSQEKKVAEKSHVITPGKKGKRQFKKAIEKLGKKYDQDSVLIQRKGGGSATLKGTSKTSWPGKGKNVKIGKMKPGRTGEFDTKVKNKTFTVED